MDDAHTKSNSLIQQRNQLANILLSLEIMTWGIHLCVRACACYCVRVYVCVLAGLTISRYMDANGNRATTGQQHLLQELTNAKRGNHKFWDGQFWDWRQSQNRALSRQ